MVSASANLQISLKLNALPKVLIEWFNNRYSRFRNSIFFQSCRLSFRLCPRGNYRYAVFFVIVKFNEWKIIIRGLLCQTGKHWSCRKCILTNLSLGGRYLPLCQGMSSLHSPNRLQTIQFIQVQFDHSFIRYFLLFNLVINFSWLYFISFSFKLWVQ